MQKHPLVTVFACALLGALIAVPIARATPPLDLFHSVAAAWSAADIATAVDAPLSAEPDRITGSLSTTPLDVDDGDDPSGSDILADRAQVVRVVNKHATQYVCLGTVAWATSCALSGLTCSGASTDGTVVLPGTSIVRVYDGTRRPCVVASAAATTYQTELLRRAAQ